MSMDRTIKKRFWTGQRVVFILIGLTITGLIGYLWLSAGEGTALRVEKDRLTISEVVRGPFREFIPVVSSVLPLHTIYMDAVEGGRVEAVFVQAGAMVKEGDPLFRLSNTNLLLDVMTREAELHQNSNNLRNTRMQMEQYELSLQKDLADQDFQIALTGRDFERKKWLLKERLIAQQEYDDVRDRFDYLKKKREMTLATGEQERKLRREQIQQLEASLQQLQDNHQLVRQKLDNLTYRAPVSGLLSSLDVEKGQNKPSGQRLGQIDMMDGFKVRAEIDEHYLNRVQIGKEGQFDFAGQSHQLVIRTIYPEVRNGRFEVDMQFTGPLPDGIRRGQTLHLRLNLSDEKEAVLLATGGFYQTTGGNWVYIVDAAGSGAVRRNIRLGMYNSEVYEVLEGLAPGDRVVTSSYETYGQIDRLIFK